MVVIFNQFCIFPAGKQQQIMGSSAIRKGPKTDDGKLIKVPALQQFEKEMKDAESENLKIPQKKLNIFRIMTYNIHFWRDPYNQKNNLAQMIAVIKKINPDLLILQEVTTGKMDFNTSPIRQTIEKEIGLKYFNDCNAFKHSWFGNIIASKIPFIKTDQFNFKEDELGKRCVVFAQMELQNKNLNVYGTHLEVSGNDNIRKEQIKEIADKIAKEHKDQNCLIAGDFNATRDSGTVKLLTDNGYTDCFTHLGWQHPNITNWTGIEIDFIFLSPNWNLVIDGCYVYNDSSSDHLPIIMDIAIPEKINPIEAFYSLSNQLNALRIKT